MRRIGLLPLLCLALSGCAATVTPPDAPREPRTLYLVDHGYHTSLILTTADEDLVRWAYGEWRWYVEGERGSARLFPVLAMPTQAALGRGAVRAAPDPAAIRAALPVVTERIMAFDAEAPLVDGLLARNETLFAAGLEDGHYDNHWVGLVFVRHPVPYTFRHNSNHVIADWLEQMAFRVDGNPMFGRWRLATVP